MPVILMMIRVFNIYPVVRNATLMVLITELSLCLLNIDSKFFAQVVWFAAGILCCFYFYLFILMKSSKKIRGWQRVALEVIAVAATSLMVFAGSAWMFYKAHPAFIKVFPIGELAQSFAHIGIVGNLIVLCATVIVEKSGLELTYSVSKMRWWDWITILSGAGYLVWGSIKSAPKY